MPFDVDMSLSCDLSLCIVEPQRCSSLSPHSTSFSLSLINYKLNWSIGLIKIALRIYIMTNLLCFYDFVGVVILTKTRLQNTGIP